jgi:hypothetical protein
LTATTSRRPDAQAHHLTVIAQVFDDGVLGVKTPTDLKPGAYDAVLVLQRPADPPTAQAGETFVPLADYL